MASRLDSLVKNLETFRELTKFFPKPDLLTRKGVYPYDYMDSWGRCEEPQLPPKEAFHSRLTDSDITDDDYEHARKVWTEFSIRNMGEYSDLYVKTDVLLLADVFENFRDVCLKTYQLDPAWYYTAPGLTWDAMLKETGVRLELLTDYDQLLLTERGVRGGIAQCCHRYAKANNKYIGDSYDPT